MTSPAAALVLDAARAKGVMIATAESCTGGMLASAITELAGASDVFDRGFVTYSNSAKESMLGVRSDTLALHGAVSEEVAREMAQGALLRSAADLAVAVTGIAGPGSAGAKPEGRVCFAVAKTGSGVFSETREFGAIGRAEVRRASTDHALGLMHEAILRD